jgi:hypothetical protein
METHWTSQHGRKGYVHADWASAPLQSFFRGNMLRYFTSSPRPANNVAIKVSKDEHKRRLQKRHNLDSLDSEILDHYFHSFYKTFMTNDQTERIWLDVVPDLAYNIPFLLQGILACTALHMAYINPTKLHMYTIRACAHQDAAIPHFRYAIEHPDEKNCDAIVAFAYILLIYSLATDTKNSKNYLLIVEDADASSNEAEPMLPQWVHFIRAGCTMLCDVWEAIENGPASALATTWEDNISEQEATVRSEDLPYLNYFKSLVPDDGSWPEEVIQIYLTAATALAESFLCFGRAKEKSHIHLWNILGVWPLHVEVAFFSLISERHPGALILLAYYCIILKDMENCWYFEGRPAKLLSSIAEVLDTRWRPCIQEPIEIVTGSQG